MAKKLDRFILELAEKAGIAPTDPRLAPLLAHTGLKEIDMPDEIAQTVQSNLLSIDDAKNNHPAIKTHYFGEIMANVDRSLNDIYRDFGFTPEEVSELNTERSSTKRIALVAKKFNEKVEAAKNDPAKKGSANEEALKQQITDLNNQLATVKQNLTSKEKEFNDKLNAIKIDSGLSEQFGVETIFDTLPGSARNMTLKNLVDKELQDNNAHLVVGEDGSMKLLKKDGSNYFDENNKVLDVNSFVQKTFAKHKILKQSASADGGNNNQQNQGEQTQRAATTVNASQQAQSGGQTATKRNLSSVFEGRKNSLDNKNPQASMT